MLQEMETSFGGGKKRHFLDYHKIQALVVLCLKKLGEKLGMVE